MHLETRQRGAIDRQLIVTRRLHARISAVNIAGRKGAWGKQGGSEAIEAFLRSLYDEHESAIVRTFICQCDIGLSAQMPTRQLLDASGILVIFHRVATAEAAGDDDGGADLLQAAER